MSNRNRTPVRLGRSRQEIVTAAAVGTAIVILSALAVWLIRPGTPGVPGGGGLAARQPRAALLFALGVIAAIIVVVRFRHRPIRQLSNRVSIAIGLGGVAVVAVILGFVWPGGILRDYGVPSIPNPPTPPSTPATSAPAGPTPTTPAPTPTTVAAPAPTGPSGG
ncbi:MAG: hypothetical protein ACKOOG_01005 [Actinomycetota bacterium]